MENDSIKGSTAPVVSSHTVNNSIPSDELVMPDKLAEEYHSLSVEQVLKILQVNATFGLSATEVIRRQTDFGCNVLPAERPRTLLERLWEQINSMVIYVLIIGAALSFGFGHVEDGVVIFCVTIINVTMGLFMEGKAENASKRLKSMMSPIALVLRDEEKSHIDTTNMTIGDIFFIQPGDTIPADGRVLECVDLNVLESALTGESHTVFKHAQPIAAVTSVPLAERTCMVFAGTQVIKGTATCVTVQIGSACEIGKISSLLKTVTTSKTPLVLQLEKLGWYLSVSILVIAGISLLIAIFVRDYEIGDAFSIAIGIAVAAIPEGLPACVTITFATGVSSMAEKRAVVKTLPAVETLGSVNVICSDKTGTLTQNKMTVKALYTESDLYEFSDQGYLDKKIPNNPNYIDPSSSLAPTKVVSEEEADDAKAVLLANLLPAIYCNDSHIAILVQATAALPNPAALLAATTSAHAETPIKSKRKFSATYFSQLTSSADSSRHLNRRSSHRTKSSIEDGVITLRGDLESTISLSKLPVGSRNNSKASNINNTPSENKDSKNKKAMDYQVEGDPTENCLLTLSVQQLATATRIKRWVKHHPRLAQVPFDSANKYMATLHSFPASFSGTSSQMAPPTSANNDLLLHSAIQKLQMEFFKGSDLKLFDHSNKGSTDSLARIREIAESGYKHPKPAPSVNIIFVKGAPEKVVSFTSATATTEGSTAEQRAWMERSAQLAAQGMRVLALAYKIVDLPSPEGRSYQSTPEADEKMKEAESSIASTQLSEELLSTTHPTGFKLLALLGILDPPRPDAIVAIQQAQAAGITVKMITGDHPITACAIGKLLGIVNTNNSSSDIESKSTVPAITGADLDCLNEHELDHLVLHQNIFARTTPEHKLRIVQSLQRRGCVCSMTGDGVNDAPALKAANIGVAMGIAGTEVAKDAANMILIDDHFATMVDAIRVGRATYSNLMKILVFVLAADGGQALSLILALIIGLEMPIEALQILWVNMVTSISLGTVLAFEPPHSQVMQLPPRAPHKRIFGSFFTWRLLFVSLVFVATVLGNFYWEAERIQDDASIHNLSKNQIHYLRTVAVNTLVSCRIGYLFSCRYMRSSVFLRPPFSTENEPGWIRALCEGNIALHRGIWLCVILQMLFTYAPPLQYVFRTKNLDGMSWMKIIVLGIITFIVIEIEKIVSVRCCRPVFWYRQCLAHWFPSKRRRSSSCDRKMSDTGARKRSTDRGAPPNADSAVKEFSDNFSLPILEDKNSGGSISLVPTLILPTSRDQIDTTQVVPTFIGTDEYNGLSNEEEMKVGNQYSEEKVDGIYYEVEEDTDVLCAKSNENQIVAYEEL